MITVRSTSPIVALAGLLFVLSVVEGLAGPLLVRAPLGRQTTTWSLSPQGIACYYSHYFGQDLVLIARYGGELFKATNEGWQALSPPAGWSDVQVTPDGTIYLYGSYTHEIHRSTDGGETWVLTGKVPFTAGEGMNHLFASPVPDLLFLGVWDTPFFPLYKGVYKSTDAGATWKRVLEGGNGRGVDFSPDFAQDGTAFAALDEYHASVGIWKTTDWGETWFPVHNGLHIGGCVYSYQWVTVSPQFPQDQTAFTADETGLYKTTNGGESWFKIGSSTPPTSVVFSPNYIHDQILLAGHISLGLYLSHDGGQSWQYLWKGGVYDTGIRRLGPYGPPPPSPPPPGPYRVYLPLVGHNAGALEFWFAGQTEYFSDCYLYRSRDDGATWEQLAVFEASHWLYLPLVNHSTN